MLCDGGGTANSVSSSTVTANQWYYIVGLRSGTTIGLYVNAVTQGTAEESGSMSNAANLYIGCNAGSASWFNGDIACFNIYSAAKIADWVKYRYLQCIPEL
jgi:hypothetical protein